MELKKRKCILKQNIPAYKSKKLIFLGESNVYTLGTIGPHRVVSTKLPATGMARGAMIAAGSTTTRLLGKLICILLLILFFKLKISV